MISFNLYNNPIIYLHFTNEVYFPTHVLSWKVQNQSLILDSELKLYEKLPRIKILMSVSHEKIFNVMLCDKNSLEITYTGKVRKVLYQTVKSEYITRSYFHTIAFSNLFVVNKYHLLNNNRVLNNKNQTSQQT